ncbi:MAG: TrmH family RNA methyltransferase, partial [Candidatus Thiodiazotropha sp.]
FIMPKRTAFVLGHEEWGHSFERNDYPEITSVAIPQFGEVESLNVSVAASIVMYEYVRQQGSGASGSIHDEWPAHD